MILNGKVAIITGGGRGIGRVIALLFAKHGASLVIADINGEQAQATAGEIQSLGQKSLALRIDVSQLKEAERLGEATMSTFGRVDILVNNAGITRDGLFLRMKEDDWDSVLAVNLKGVFNCSKAVIRSMSKQRSGRIINLASVVGLTGNAAQANYAASKAGVIGFTKTLAREFGSRGICVNAVAPGYIDTEMTRSLPEKTKEEFLKDIPLGRMGTPEDVAEVVLFLASDASGYITGQVVSVNGGLYM